MESIHGHASKLYLPYIQRVNGFLKCWNSKKNLFIKYGENLNYIIIFLIRVAFATRHENSSVLTTASKKASRQDCGMLHSYPLGGKTIAK
jgi:hypothetical protein